MEKRQTNTRTPEASDADKQANTVPTYEVGYGRPPKHTRFRPGRSGNPRGRPKYRRNVRTVVEEKLHERIPVREGSKTRSISKLEAVIVQLIHKAAGGDVKAATALFGLLSKLGVTSEAPAPAKPDPLTDDDHAIIADHFARMRSQQRDEGSNDHDLIQST